MAKPQKTRVILSKAENNGSNGSKPKSGQKGKKPERKEPMANELMLKAWNKIYKARHDRFL